MDPTLQRSQTENKMIDLQQQLNDAEQRGDVVAQQRIQGELQAARASQSAGIYASSISSRPSSNSGQGAEVAALRQEIANLRNQRANPVPLPVSAPVPSSVAAYQGSTGPSPVVDNSASASAGGGNVIKIGSYSAAGGKNAERAGLTFADTKNYLPPNSIATARVIVGADASTNVRSQSDPIPVVLRITSRARSVVLNDKILNTDISGCLVNGAAYGDLSSEKVFVKLQKMTCAASNGGVAVSEVKGFVAFAGKSGVRGRVVSREGSFVVKAFLAGLVGGIGRLGENVASSQLYSPTITSGSNRPPIDLGAIAAGAGGSGISDAGDKVSKYLIERAEQYQPVVEMPTGIDVEVVFLDGSFVR
ncbi:MAG: conjugal transfer protein TraB [Sphingomonadales bacterium]|nr:conjugal transfer protein TraB [Sphingomonadales bacterium]